MRKHLLFHFILLAILVLNSVLAYSQADSTNVYRLGKAEVSTNRRVGVLGMERYTVGGTAYRADSTSLANLRHTSLTDYILQHTPVFIRESGNGMMASVSLRGTASSHTAVMWNGIAINSLTMGQTDFSHLPIFFFDEINVYPGGEGALYGNGAIGGVISLKTQANKEEGVYADLQQTYGSFNHTFTGGKIIIAKKKWSTKTSALYNYNKNNFKFRNSETHGFPIEKQKNALYDKFGFLHEVFFRPSAQSTLSAKVWYMNFYREMQPMMQSNNETRDYDTIRDRNLVSMINFDHRSDFMQLSVVGAYVYDKQQFRNDIIATNRFIIKAESEKNIFKSLSIKVGGYLERIIPDVYSYSSDVKEWRGDVYALFRYTINQRLEAGLNFRQSFVSRLSAPFTPSAGISYKLINKLANQLKLRTSVSKSFRAPTLNDRYWGDSGNADLLPETGVNIEAGVDYTLKLALLTLEGQFTVYQNDVTNWIQWAPRGTTWKPVNLKDVKAQGFEVGVKVSAPLAKTKLTLSGNYTYVNSEVVNGQTDNDPTKGLQLPLLPYNRWNMALDATYKKAFAQFGLNYTGDSFSSNRNTIFKTKAFTLANLSAGYSFSIAGDKHKLSLSARINNLFDKDYQSIMFFAMPKRNWNISLRYTM